MQYRKGAAPASYDAFEPSNDLRPFVHRYLYGWSQHSEGSQLQIRPTGGVFLSYLPGAPLRARISFADTLDRGRVPQIDMTMEQP